MAVAAVSTPTPARWWAGRWPTTSAKPVLDAVGMVITNRKPAAGTVHHTDPGRQYTSHEFGKALRASGLLASMGRVGSAFDALAEAFNSLFEAELVRNNGPWKGIDDLEIAVAEYIDWFNHRRPRGEIGLIPPPSTKTTSTGTTPRRLPSPRQFRASTEPRGGTHRRAGSSTSVT
jgi:transposase InsO family protein